MKNITWGDVFDELEIPEYADAIFTSNSRGELMHLSKYRPFFKIQKDQRTWFKPAFERMVEHSKQFERPASVYQHVDKIFGYVAKEDQELAFCQYHLQGNIEDRDYLESLKDSSLDSMKKDVAMAIEVLSDRIAQILESRKIA